MGAGNQTQTLSCIRKRAEATGATPASSTPLYRCPGVPSFAVTNTMARNQVREESLSLVYRPFITEAKAGAEGSSLRQAEKQNRGSAAHWLAPCGLLTCVLTQSGHLPRGGTPQWAGPSYINR